MLARDSQSGIKIRKKIRKKKIKEKKKTGSVRVSPSSVVSYPDVLAEQNCLHGFDDSWGTCLGEQVMRKRDER